MPPDAEPQPRRILIVDDNRDFAASLAAYLGARGYEVATASSPRDQPAALRDPSAAVAMIDTRAAETMGAELRRAAARGAAGPPPHRHGGDAGHRVRDRVLPRRGARLLRQILRARGDPRHRRALFPQEPDGPDVRGRARDSAPRARRGRGREQGQVRIPRHHEPRAAHALERHHRLLRADDARRAGARRQRATTSPTSRTFTTAAGTSSTSSTTSSNSRRPRRASSNSSNPRSMSARWWPRCCASSGPRRATPGSCCATGCRRTCRACGATSASSSRCCSTC